MGVRSIEKLAQGAEPRRENGYMVLFEVFNLGRKNGDIVPFEVFKPQQYDNTIVPANSSVFVSAGYPL